MARLDKRTILVLLLVVAAGTVATQQVATRMGSDSASHSVGADSVDLAEAGPEASGGGIVPDPAFGHNQLGLSDTIGAQAGFSSAIPGSDEGDARVIWYVNGAEVHEGITLNPEWFRPGDRVSVVVERTDESGESEKMKVASAFIHNSPPKIASIVLERSRFGGNVARAHVEAYDADDDIIHLSYQWYVDGKPSEGATNDSFSLEGLRRGVSVKVAVVASDNNAETGPETSGSLIYDNNNPELRVSASAKATPMGDGTYRLVCPVEVVDSDGDVVQVEIMNDVAGVRWDGAALIWEGATPGLSRTVTLRATDSKGGHVERDVQLKV